MKKLIALLLSLITILAIAPACSINDTEVSVIWLNYSAERALKGDCDQFQATIADAFDRGAYIEFDNFGKEFYVSEERRFAYDLERIRLLRTLIDEGYLKQLLLSCDVCLKTCLRTYGGYGYDHVLVNIVPMMEDAGISSAAIDDLLIYNPAEFLDNGGLL